MALKKVSGHFRSKNRPQSFLDFYHRTIESDMQNQDSYEILPKTTYFSGFYDPLLRYVKKWHFLKNEHLKKILRAALIFCLFSRILTGKFCRSKAKRSPKNFWIEPAIPGVQLCHYPSPKNQIFSVHLSPSITIAQLFSLSTPWYLCILFFIQQFIGAIIGISLFYVSFSNEK